MDNEAENTPKPKTAPGPLLRNATTDKDMTNYTVPAAASTPKGGSAPTSKAPGDSSTLQDGASSTNDAAHPRSVLLQKTRLPPSIPVLLEVVILPKGIRLLEMDWLVKILRRI
jgi:hypothetical protein